MNNKGTQALLSSDVGVIKEIVSRCSISISTTDIDGVNKLNLPVDSVLPLAKKAVIPVVKAVP